MPTPARPAPPTAAPTSAVPGGPPLSLTPAELARCERLADDGCGYCGGVGWLLACRPGHLPGGVVVRCACSYRSNADRVLRALHLHRLRHWWPPSLRELAAVTGLPCSTVNDAIDNLAARGLVRRGRGSRARAYGVVR